MREPDIGEEKFLEQLMDLIDAYEIDRIPTYRIVEILQDHAMDMLEMENQRNGIARAS